MKIEVNLFATLAAFKPSDTGKGSWEMECPDGITIGRLLSELKIPPEKVKVIFRNGVHARVDDPLADGDRIGVFPPLGGG